MRAAACSRITPAEFLKQGLFDIDIVMARYTTLTEMSNNPCF